MRTNNLTTIHGLFRQQARQTPTTVALIGAELQYTYAELDRITDRYAQYLLAQGVGPETIVGCWTHDSCMTVLCVLSVLKAGGAYLLLDPALPEDRLRYMVADSKPACIIVDEAAPKGIADMCSIVPIREIPGQPTGHGSAPSWPKIAPDSLAYVAYTSGSTGVPKGVLITHGATVNHALAFSALFDLRPGDRLPLLAPLAFDMATEEMIPPLISGCTLLDAPAVSPSMQEFTQSVIHHAYTILNLPAPLWHQWTSYLHDADLPVPPALRLVIVGSDKIYTDQYNVWRTLAGAEGVRWVAAYGVTEATVTSTFYLTAAKDDLSKEPFMPIGTPITGVTTYILTEDRKPVAPGEAGELYIGGAGLARGYQNLPEKTAERFVPDPFTLKPDARMYATGDKVRSLANGALVWLGRNDSQIKINGLRIEPGEIEAALYAYPGVHEVVVVFTPAIDKLQAGTLTAYVEPDTGQHVNEAALRSFLAKRLPARMIPQMIVILQKIPLNTNGKLDRKALSQKDVYNVTP